MSNNSRLIYVQIDQMIHNQNDYALKTTIKKKKEKGTRIPNWIEAQQSG